MTTRGSILKTNPWRRITLEELAQHTNVDGNDAWMAIRGVVYDVAAYAALHPGGADKIRKYVGKDATETFNAVHSYVDAQDILGPHQVAILNGYVGAPKRPSRVDGGGGCCNWVFGKGYKAPTTYCKQDSIIVKYIIEFEHPSEENDWSVGILDKKILQVYKCVDTKKAWLSTYPLPEPLFNDRIVLEFENQFQYVHIALRKPVPTTVWAKQTHGLKECGEYVPIQEGHSKFDAFITYKKCVTQNMIIFGIQVVKSARIGVPVGLHVNLSIGDIVRPYTPVCYCIVESTIKEMPPDDGSTMLYFIIKIYPDGKMTQALDAVELDDGNEVPTLQISMPYGNFNRRILDDFSLLILIAGGSGITPMIRIIKHFWEIKKNEMHGKHVVLIYFCDKDHDLAWKKQFIQLEEQTSWFRYFPVLTKPSETCNWQGLTGRINPEMVQLCLKQIPYEKGIKRACICGPPGFNSAAVDSLGGVVISDHIYVFAG